MATSTKPKQTDIATSDKTKITADQIKKEFEQSWNYRDGGYHVRWKNNWKLYNNQRTDRQYKGLSDTFVPMTFSIVESTVANVVGGKPKFTYTATTPEQQGDVRMLNTWADYVWDRTKQQNKVIPWARDVINLGTGIQFWFWDGNLNVPNSRHIALPDFWIDPTARDIEHAEEEGLPCGFRYLTTKDALKRRMIVNANYDPEDPKSAQMVPLYDHKAIDAASDFSGADTDKQEKDNLNGSTLGDNGKESGQVEVIVRYTWDGTQGRLTEVLNREHIIRDEDNPFEMLPFAPEVDFKDSQLFYGKSHTDVIADRQERLNDHENQDADNMTHYMDNMYRIDPQYAGLMPQITSGPGVGLPVPSGAIEFFPKPAYNPKASERRMELKTDMREAVGAGEILQAGGSQTADKTATEINSEMANAGKRFDVLIQQFENNSFQRIGKILLKYLQLFGDDSVTLPITGPTGTNFVEMLKADFPGDYEPKIQLEASAKSEFAQNSQKYEEAYQVLSLNPLVDQNELTRLFATKRLGLDDDEAKLLLKQQPTLPGQDPNAMDAPMGADPMMAPPMGAPVDPNADPNATPAPPVDLVRLYAAAATAGDTSLMEQITVDLGFTPGPDTPVTILDKQHAIHDRKLGRALDIHGKQLEAADPNALPV